MKPDLRKLFLPSIFLCFLAEIHLVVAGKVSFVTKSPVSFPSSSQFSNPLKNWWDIPLNGELEPTFFLQLHNISFDTVKNYSYPIIIVDPQEAQFDQEQVMDLRATNKTILAYVSIGLADVTKPYWRPTWSSSPPSFIIGPSPDQPEKYLVRFWTLHWQRIILRYTMDQVLSMGYSGLLLDNLAVYRNIPDQQINSRDEILALLRTMRTKSQLDYPGSQIFVHNISELFNSSRFRSSVDGLLEKNVWFSDNNETNEVAKQDFDQRLANLRAAQIDGKVITVADLPDSTEKVCAFYEKCHAQQFFCLVADSRWSGVTHTCERTKISTLSSLVLGNEPSRSSTSGGNTCGENLASIICSLTVLSTLLPLWFTLA